MNKNIKYILISFAIIVPILLAILIYNDKITMNSPVYYKQGVYFYDKGDYQNAYYNFSKIRRISPLYQMAVFKQAKSAQKTGDFKTAVLKYNQFLKHNKNSIFASSAVYNLAKCYFALNNYDEAKKLFEQTKAKTGKQYSTEDYFLGVINEKTNKELAIENFKNYLKGDETTDRNYEIAAADEMALLSQNFSAEENFLIANAYYKNKKYTQAVQYFSKVPLALGWDYLVLSNHYAGNKIIAKKLIETGLVPYSYNVSKDNLHKIYDVYTSYLIGNRTKNWTFMLNLVQAKSLNGEDYLLYKLAQMVPPNKALEYYSKINSKYPKSDYAPEALWNIFWAKYERKEYSSAESIAQDHLKRFKDVNSTPKILFWLAKTDLKLNKISEAHSVLTKLISKYPDDYYGLRASYVMNNKTDFWSIRNLKALPAEKDIEFPITLSNIDIKDIKLINSLFKLGDYDIWLNANFDNKIVESWFELRKDRKSRSTVLARDAIKEMDVKPSFLNPAFKLAYPLHYVDEINIAGNKLGISPYFIISIIKEESHFDTGAKSNTNAQGLMQIMPSTANYVANVLYMPSTSLSNLEDVKTNIYIGGNYLKYLNEKFNNPIFVVAAYNAGEGAVAKWVTAYKQDDYDAFIENIPYEETRNYVKRVFRTYHLYSTIY